MAEAIVEMVIPGTYIEVRAEGLLVAPDVSVGNVGIIGTAERGTTAVQRLSSFNEVAARFGGMGEWDGDSPDDNLGLVRGLRLLFDNGASTVYARRVVDSTAARPARYQIRSGGAPMLTLQAKTPGAWGNRLELRVEEADARDHVQNERLIARSGVLALSAGAVDAPQANGGGAADAPPVGSVTVTDAGLTRRFHLRSSAPAADVVQVNPNRSLTFAAPPSPRAQVMASYWVPRESLRKVTIRNGDMQEVFLVPSLSFLAQALTNADAPSRLVDVVQIDGDALPDPTPRFEAFTAGENGSVNLSHFQAALDSLINEDVQIIAVVGLPFSRVKSAILGHLEQTENLGRERIAVVGADSSDVEKILENANDVADKRLVLVAPGLRQRDPVTEREIHLKPTYAAAAVAGKLASLAPHISITNKTLAGIDALAAHYNDGELKALIQNRVLVLRRHNGTRAVKGITTDDGAFRQISIRRIVDYVKRRTREGANQYIGLLNNRRVRKALQTTLEGMLADMKSREMLRDYQLKIEATDEMQRRGEVLVTMEVMPTFSIDYIRVVMNLS